MGPIYDVIDIPFSRVRDKVVDFTNARNGSKILDVATGTGKQAFAFAKKKVMRASELIYQKIC